MEDKNVKLLLVDDHPMLRLGLREAVARQAHLSVVGEASTGAQAVNLARELQPAVVVMDIHLPDMNGIEAARFVLSVQPGVKIIIFSGDRSRLLVDGALQAGAVAYILKKGDVSEVIQAIDLVMEGKVYLSPEVSAGILDDYRKSFLERSEPLKPVLSEREKLLLGLVAEGRRNKEIAAHLTLSTKSVEACRSRLMKKLGYSNSAELVRYAIREGGFVP